MIRMRFSTAQLVARLLLLVAFVAIVSQSDAAAPVWANVPGSVNGMSCVCAVERNTTVVKYTGTCTIYSGYVDPLDYECKCGLAGAEFVVACNGTARTEYVADTTDDPPAYCVALDAETLPTFRESECVTRAQYAVDDILPCDTDGDVYEKIAKTVASLNASCTKTTKRAPCSSCVASNTTANTTWYYSIPDKTSVCRCEIDDSNDDYVEVAVGCVTDDDTTLDGYFCRCGLVALNCTERAAGNITAMRTVLIEKEADNSHISTCTDEFAIAYHGSTPICMNTSTEHACDDMTGVAENYAVTVTGDSCTRTTWRDICTGTLPCEDFAHQCVFVNHTYECDAPCGDDAWAKRVVVIRYPAVGTGFACPEQLVTYRHCVEADTDYNATCNANCTIDADADWSAWSHCEGPCSSTEGEEIGWQFRTKRVAEEHDDVGCPEVIHQWRECLSRIPKACSYDTGDSTDVVVVVLQMLVYAFVVFGLGGIVYHHCRKRMRAR
jgi:hypothetical protein